MNTLHQPVLLQEVLDNLVVLPDGKYIDGTFGRGGHAAAILQRLGPDGKLLVMDKDPDAIAAAKDSNLFHDPRLVIQQGSFTQIKAMAQQLDWLGQVQGILLDLGVSSPQLDQAERGFSFMKEGPLDMRMDTTQSLDARQWINSTSAQEMQRVFSEYGEERYSPRIARAICAARETQEITTTTQLAEIVAKAHPRWEKHKHPATRVFQAIRIVINRELEELQQTLEHSLEVLAIGGRLLVITFHSLEDHVVKQFFNKYGSTMGLPKGLAIPQADIEANLRVKRIAAIKPSEKETSSNPRARSATLRIMEKRK